MVHPDTARSEAHRRLTSAWVIREILGRTFLPHHAAHWIRLRRRRSRIPAVSRNAQLNLFSQVLRGDFLHYGYFDDAQVTPDRIGFHDLEQAQLRYAQELVRLIDRRGAPVLDVGSGMGGLLRMLRDAGLDATGLTPDVLQVEHIRRAQRGVPVLHCRFEDLPAEDYSGVFGTVLHAESIQYMDPDRVFPIVTRILAPGGLWIVADYFRTRAGGERSGWPWEDFRQRVGEHGFRLVHCRDITAHVLPTLGFAHLLATRIGFPLFDFAHDKVRTKSPSVHYIVENILARIRWSGQGAVALLDPDEFARRKRYMLMGLRRVG